MSQEPDEPLTNDPDAERGYDPASFRTPPRRPSGQGIPRRPPTQPQAQRPYLSPQDERLARLREMREQRQQFGTGPLPHEAFQRRGLPTPPPTQVPLRELLKHWWYNGPFAGRPPSATDPDAEARRPPRPSSPPLPGAQPPPLEAQAREWIAQGRKGLSIASAKAKNLLNQTRDQINQKTQSPPKPFGAEEIVPGLIVVGFAPNISRQEAVQEISALGGKPLRHKAALNLYQVAVPIGQEQTLVQQFRQRPGVISAELERPAPPR